MKPFRFSLQSLHLLREQKEQVAQKKYAEALRVAQDVAVRTDQARLERAAAWSGLCQAVSVGATIWELLPLRGWCGELERRCDALAADSTLAETRVREAGRELARAAREREALDRWRDKCRRAFELRLRRSEQKALDEMGLTRNHGLRNGAGAEFRDGRSETFNFHTK